MCETQIAVEQRLLKMSDREVANCLHRLEQTFLKLSKTEKEFKSHYEYIYKILKSIKKTNTTTEGRANSLKIFIDNLERDLTGKGLTTGMISLTREVIYWSVVRNGCFNKFKGGV